MAQGPNSPHSAHGSFVDAESPDVNHEEPRRKKKYCFGYLTKAWLIFIISMIVALSFVLILIFVVGRSFAQKSVDDSVMVVNAMSIEEVKDNSMTVNMKAELRNFAPISATLKESRMKMYYKEKKFAEFDMPEIKLDAAGSTFLEISQTLDVGDNVEFSSFNYDLISQALTDIEIKSEVDIRALGISYGSLDMNKLIQISGLNNFNDPPPEILSQVVNSGSENTVDLVINACLTNPGIVTFNDLGKMTLDMYYNDILVGETVIGANSGLPLKKGKNCWELQATVTRTEENYDTVTELVSAVASTKPLTLKLRGNKKTSKYSLLQDAMSRMETTATFEPLKTMPVPKSPRISGFDSSPDAIKNAIYGIDAQSLLEYTTTYPLENLAYPIQAVFNPTPSKYNFLFEPLGAGQTIGGEKIPEDGVCRDLGLSKTTCIQSIDLSATTYVDVKALIYNPLNTTLQLMGTQLDVDFSKSNEWDCKVPQLDMSDPLNTDYSKGQFLDTCLNVTDICDFDDNNHASFRMASTLQEVTGEPLLTIPPFGKTFLHTRMCLSAYSISWMSTWLNSKVSYDTSSYFMWLSSVGNLDIKIGEFSTKLKMKQELPIYGMYYQNAEDFPFLPSVYNENSQVKNLK